MLRLTCFFRMKCLIFLFFIGCDSQIVNLSSESPEWCFHHFNTRSDFENYITLHENYASDSSSSHSMQLLGCAYYQKGDFLNAVKWLTSSYQAGAKSSAAALTAIYLKEGSLDKSDSWQKAITVETDQVRWLSVIEKIKKYQKLNHTAYLAEAYQALEYKINYEGSTDMTEGLLTVMSDLLDQEKDCQNQASGSCSVSNFNERKNYLFILAEGALAVMVPFVPQSWKAALPPEEEISSPKKNQEETV